MQFTNTPLKAFYPCVLALLAVLALSLMAPAAATVAQDGQAAQDSQQPPTPPEPVPPVPPIPEEGQDDETEEQDQQDGEEGATEEADGEKDGEKKDEEKKWDVGEPPGPISEFELDVREGTWMSLDVSPEGDEIVFDLLGDLYTLPIAGGEATVLTQGLAWDMQPRYSPDGRHIAFTSDRAGGDNVWVMKRDGSDPKAVTEESFRLLNSPAWSPDGEFLVARKHFTSARSLGAGEMWLYHRSGGGGLQMTERPNDQKDVGEPVFSPDGRYLYYSQDSTPGPFFEYNKDSNTQIYVIYRLDRETGEIDPYVTGPGGAVRPTPSPDGRKLAFVRRVRFQSTLFLKDLESGREWPLYDQLERDMQETWAVHGVYPTMAWTPDSRSIVLWAGGKIRRVDATSGEATEIPFHVKNTHRMVEALRFPVEVAPDEVRLEMLRWIQVSPTGDRAVFQALGKLWIRDLPDGKARRLTRDEENFEFYPSFSRDGRQIVYTTWNDANFGSVRVIAAGGGQDGKVLTPQPGRYVEPALSPDGKTVVYRKIGGGWLLGSTWSQDPGIYRLSLAGGEPERVTRRGEQPQFGAGNDRIYLLRAEGDKRQLVSLDLDGSDERSHVSTEWATQMRLSPDENWLAFTERFNAYVIPFTRTGREFQLGPKSKAVPLSRISRDAGENLHWSGDGRTLYWSLGPELFERPLPELFAFVEGAPEELPKPPETGLDLGFTVPADKPQGTIALVGGKVVTMRGDEVIEDGVVVVEGNRIRAVGPRAEVAVPAGAREIDVTGHTVIPGLIDVHWHGSQGDEEITPQQSWVNYASLAFGVTTLHDPSNDTSEIFAAAELARTGAVVAPRIFSTGTILYGATTAFTAEVESLDDARSHLRRMQAAGAISVKSYNQPRRDQRQQFIAGARELGMMVVPEGGSLFQHNMNMIADGHTGIEHSIPVANVYEDVLQFWSHSAVGYTPTLGVGYGGIWGENYWYHHTNVWEDERLLTFVPRPLIDAQARRRVMAPEEEYNHVDNARVVHELAQRGVKAQLGAHGQREGLAAHWELWMFVQGGMTPHEALRAGTLWGAEYLGMDGDLGSIEEGKLADVLVLDADPLADIKNSRNVRYVLLNGRLYDGASLDEIAPRERPRKPFYFEGEGAASVTCATADCAGPAAGLCRH